MPVLLKLPGKVAHGRKYGDDLLRVVQHVIGFLAHLHQHVDHISPWRLEPAVQGVELVTQNKSQRGHSTLPWAGTFWLRQRSEQYFTSSHTFSHFLRQVKGRAQLAQTLLGSSDFLRMRMVAKFLKLKLKPVT